MLYSTEIYEENEVPEEFKNLMEAQMIESGYNINDFDFCQLLSSDGILFELLYETDEEFFVNADIKRFNDGTLIVQEFSAERD